MACVCAAFTGATCGPKCPRPALRCVQPGNGAWCSWRGARPPQNVRVGQKMPKNAVATLILGLSALLARAHGSVGRHSGRACPAHARGRPVVPAMGLGRPHVRDLHPRRFARIRPPRPNPSHCEQLQRAPRAVPGSASTLPGCPKGPEKGPRSPFRAGAGFLK